MAIHEPAVAQEVDERTEQISIPYVPKDLSDPVRARHLLMRIDAAALKACGDMGGLSIPTQEIIEWSDCHHESFARGVAAFHSPWMQGHMHYSNGTTMLRSDHLIYQPDVLVNGAVTWHIPAIKGALRATANYNGKFLTGLGSTRDENTGQGSVFMLNMALWHQVYKNVSFKYEVQNLSNTHFNNVIGSKLQYTNNTNYLGRGVYFHVILDYK
ncbi:UrcA family protein [Acetobacter senegalensis]|uniref:UrcA family protein n=1 Tax=Acetobacter senegalensis TaxID=446692 RepID=UPI001EDC40C1|nr:UrcA family protein [Acetobacter senegalensis]MCG4255020.1 UrcA family protein [Acetobacter senegalensis]